MTLARSSFGIFDPEFARVVNAISPAAQRMARLRETHGEGSVEYQVAKLAYKAALKAAADYAQARGGQS